MIKMLMFDYRESEKKYFEHNDIEDFEISFHRESLNESTLLTEEEKNETAVLSVFINSRITEKVINQFKNLRVISTRSTGYNHIDLNACMDRNIAVLNVGDYGRTSVAQFTIGMIVAMVRNFIPAANDVKNRHTIHEKYEGRDISKLALGVIGTGSIGSAVCELADVFGMKIYAHDIKVNNNIKEFVEYVSLGELLSNSDIITLHVPYIKEFHHMISKKEFDIMKQDAYIINTARGELIDTSALYDAIKDGKLKGAALDVIECEELNSNIVDFDKTLKTASCECLESTILAQKLMSFDNVIVTPHIAYNTKDSINIILDTMFYDIKNYYQGSHTNQIV
ncbi:MAG: hypothetical protein NC200_03995 [Candidatus Gastranaerophilales bacterium]|nr:hypothetical protein [Candidatus Gastranaerophilales bacterium]